MSHFPLRHLVKPFSFNPPSTPTAYPPLDIAKKRVCAYEERAALSTANGDRWDAQEARRRAKLWRLWNSYPEDMAKRHYSEYEEDALNAIDKLLARAEISDQALIYLRLILYHILEGFHLLSAHGSETALAMLLSELNTTVVANEILANEKPELFREYARKSFGIPGIISRNREKTQENQRLLEKLKQGEEFALKILPTGRRGKIWKFKDNANSLAASLVHYIQINKILFPVFAHQVTLMPSRFHPLPSWLAEAGRLPGFSPQSWRQWAEVGWRIIRESSPKQKPGLNPMFDDPGTKICNVRRKRKSPYYGKIEQSPSIAEHDIQEALFIAFELIATGVSPRTKQRRKAHPTIR